MADPEFIGAGREMIARTGRGYDADGRYAGEAGTPERLELRRVFRERAKSYDFWIDNGLALVGSPDTVIRKIQEQHDLIGHDVLCTQHGFGRLAPELVKKSIKLFGEEVIPALAWETAGSIPFPPVRGKVGMGGRSARPTPPELSPIEGEGHCEKATRIKYLPLSAP
jgi:hypothetical protein